MTRPKTLLRPRRKTYFQSSDPTRQIS